MALFDVAEEINQTLSIWLNDFDKYRDRNQISNAEFVGWYKLNTRTCLEYLDVYRASSWVRYRAYVVPIIHIFWQYKAGLSCLETLQVPARNASRRAVAEMKRGRAFRVERFSLPSGSQVFHCVWSRSTYFQQGFYATNCRTL